MIRQEEPDDPRRRVLIEALTAGLFSTILPGGGTLAAEIFDTGTSKLPAGRSIYRLSGRVLVNGVQATLETRIFAGDTVETSKDGEIVFIVGGNSMIMRANSRMELRTENKESFILTGLRMLSGKLLSVSRNRPMQVQTITATIGIRGTGFYMEADPEQTYFCTCYGATEIASNDDPNSKDSIVAKQHDKPIYILSGDRGGKGIRRAPFVNHTDQELMLIESLVGRAPPFVFPSSNYSAPRRDY